MNGINRKSTKHDLLQILENYLIMIERDKGEHPAVVLDDIRVSIKYILKKNNK